MNMDNKLGWEIVTWANSSYKEEMDKDLNVITLNEMNMHVAFFS